MVQVFADRATAKGSDAALAGGTSLPPCFVPDAVPDLSRMVRGLAGRLHARLPRGCGIEVSDLIQAGNVGLMQAAWSFEAAQGTPLAGFAKYRIRGEMLDMVRRHAGRDQSPRPVKAFNNEPDGWESSISAAEDNSPQACALRRQRTQILAEELRRLPARDRKVVRLRYSSEFTLREIGTELSVNESRACQIHQSALNRLRRALWNRGVRGICHI